MKCIPFKAEFVLNHLMIYLQATKIEKIKHRESYEVLTSTLPKIWKEENVENSTKSFESKEQQ